MTIHLSARDVAFAYPNTPDDVVLSGVTLTVRTKDRLGVVGENGSGKSTLLALLTGDLNPTTGTIKRRGSFAVVEQELQVGAGETVADLMAASLQAAREATERLEVALTDPDPQVVTEALERYEALAAWDAERLLDEALTRLGAPRDPERRLAQMSTGERYRVRLACRLSEASELLLLDEPTNHLDSAAVGYLTGRLRTWPGAVVVVTHDRQLLDDVATAVLDLDPTMNGAVALFGARKRRPEEGDGPKIFSYADYRASKDGTLKRWRSRYRREQERLAELFEQRDYAYEHLSDEWRPPKGSQAHRRATRAKQHVKAADRAHAALEAAAVSIPPPPPELALPLLRSPHIDDGAAILRLDGAVVPGRLERPDLGVEIGVGGRLVVVGPNGSGKTTLLGLLAHAAAPGVRVGVLSQEPDFGGSEEATATAIATERIMEAVANGAVDPNQLVPLLATGLIAEEQLDRPVRELSTGQRRRLDLALTLMLGPHLLVLDEPTNHLAVDLMDALTDWLVRTPAAVVVATHDRRMRFDLGPQAHAWPVLDLTEG